MATSTNDRIQEVYRRQAPRYDQLIRVWLRVLSFIVGSPVDVRERHR
jgi:hypothetical protein